MVFIQLKAARFELRGAAAHKVRPFFKEKRQAKRACRDEVSQMIVHIIMCKESPGSIGQDAG